MKLIAFIVSIALLLNACPAIYAQETPPKPSEVFEKVELLTLNGKKLEKLPVRLRLEGKFLIVELEKTGEELKKFRYEDIKFAEYSYSKHPRWKTALAAVGIGTGSVVGLAAISEGAIGAIYGLVVVFPFALVVGLPIAATKSRRHWLTIRTGQDYVVLRLEKNIRKLVIPAVENRTGLIVEDVGEKK